MSGAERPAGRAFGFCGGCGAAGLRHEDNAAVCDACGWCLYSNPAAAAAVLLELPPEAPPPPPPEAPPEAPAASHPRLLLVRRSREPARGLLGIPGGFVDAGETAEQAARRELREELGLELPPAPLAFLCTAPNVYPCRGVVYRTMDVVFRAPLLGPPPAWHDPSEIAELVPVDPFGVDDAALAFPATRAALRAWRERATG